MSRGLKLIQTLRTLNVLLTSKVIIGQTQRGKFLLKSAMEI